MSDAALCEGREVADRPHARARDRLPRRGKAGRGRGVRRRLLGGRGGDGGDGLIEALVIGVVGGTRDGHVGLQQRVLVQRTALSAAHGSEERRGRAGIKTGLGERGEARGGKGSGK